VNGLFASLGVGLRLARGAGHVGWLRLGAIAVSVAFALTVLVGVTAVPGAIEARRAREAAREPAPGLVDGGTSTRVAQIRDRWHGRTIVRVVVEVGPGAPVPPGLAELPAPGTSALSPGLEAAIAADPSLGRRFPRPARRIAPDGLVSDRDLLAYVGVPRGALGGGGEPAQRFGLPPRLVETISGRLLWTLLFGLSVFVLAPVAGVVVAATRLAAAARARRWQALRILGASVRQVRAIVATEALVGSAAGVVLGLGLLAERPGSGSVTIGTTSVFASDLRPPPLALGVVAVLLPFVVSGVAVLAATGATRLPTATRPVRTAARRGRLAVVPLAAALTILTIGLPVADAVDLSRGTRQQLLFAAVVLSAAGMASALGLGVQRLARWSAAARRRPATVLAIRALAADPGAFTRMVGLLTTVLLALGLAMVVGTQFGSDQVLRAQLVQQQRNGGRPLAQLMSSMGSGMDVASLDGRDGVRIALPTPLILDRPGGEGIGQAVLATCAQLDVMAAPVRGCVDGQIGQLVGLGRSAPPPPAQAVIEGRAGSASISASTASPVEVGLPESAGLDGALIVPPSRLDGVGGAAVRLAEVVLTPAPDALDRLRDAAPTLQPDALVQVPFDTAGVDDHSANARWVVLGAGATLVLGAGGLLLTAVDGITGRRRRFAALVIVGAPRRVLREAAFQEVLWPLLLGVVLAVGMVVLDGVALVAQGRGDRVDPRMILRLSGGAALFSVGLAWVTSRAVSIRLRPEVLRSE
jgi:hypothetical protein